MKQKSIIVTSFLFSFFLLTSCGDESPSACDCAEYTFGFATEYQKQPPLPYTSEYKQIQLEEEVLGKESETGKKARATNRILYELHLYNNWRGRLGPCEEKAKTNSSFQEEIDECLELIKKEKNLQGDFFL